MTRAPSVKLLTSIALACFFLLIGALALLHVLRPENDPRTRHLSEYVAGPYGYLMTVAFLAACLGLAALAAASWRAVERSIWIRLACLGLVAAAAANALMAAFAADSTVPDAAGHLLSSPVGVLHERIANLHALVWAGTVVAVPLAVLADSRARRLFARSAGAGALVLAAMGARALAPASWEGLAQRAWVSAVMVWCVSHALAWRAQSQAAGLP